LATRKHERYTVLRLEHFTPHEARALSILRSNTPALKLVRQERLERWAHFEHYAAGKVSRGKWRRQDVPHKWLDNLSRMYTKKRWRVREGPVGDQTDMPKGSPNPWAMYRDAERRMGGPDSKNYISPWEIRQLTHGKTDLQRGLVFVQQVERKAKEKERTGLDRTLVAQWIAEKEDAIRDARGKRRDQLIIEKNRLERLL